MNTKEKLAMDRRVRKNDGMKKVMKKIATK